MFCWGVHVVGLFLLFPGIFLITVSGAVGYGLTTEHLTAGLASISFTVRHHYDTVTREKEYQDPVYLITAAKASFSGRASSAGDPAALG